MNLSRSLIFVPKRANGPSVNSFVVDVGMVDDAMMHSGLLQSIKRAAQLQKQGSWPKFLVMLRKEILG